MSRPKIAAWVAIAALLVLPAVAQPPAAVVVDKATVTDIDQLRRVTGQIRAHQRSMIASQEEGWVVELAVRAGDAVERGETLARLDPMRAELEVERQRAVLTSAEAILAERQIESDRTDRELERLRGLADQGIAGEQEVDDAESAHRAAQAAVRSVEADVLAARASVRLAERRLQDMAITAPFAGRVVSTRTEVGQWVEFGGTIVELLATDKYEAWADVPQQIVTNLETSSGHIEVRVPSAGYVTVVNDPVLVPAADELSRIFPLRAVLDAQDTAIRPGMSADIYVPTGERKPTMSIHKDAVLRDDAGLFVYFLVPYQPQPGTPPEMSEGIEWQAVPARIERLFGFGDRVAIRDGALPPGAMVVTEGNERMYPTQPVMITQQPTAETPSEINTPAPAGPAGGE